MRGTTAEKSSNKRRGLYYGSHQSWYSLSPVRVGFVVWYSFFSKYLCSLLLVLCPSVHTQSVTTQSLLFHQWLHITGVFLWAVEFPSGTEEDSDVGFVDVLHVSQECGAFSFKGWFQELWLPDCDSEGTAFLWSARKHYWSITLRR
jgi:hypothetical protein